MKRELRDLGRLVACVLLPLAVWFLLGYRPGVIPFGSDARDLDWPAFTELARVGGDTARWTYRATLIGGGRFYEMIGGLPLSSIGNHLSAADRILFHALIGQALLAFFGVLAVEALVGTWRADRYELPWHTVPWVALALAFMPLAGMRYNAGHVSIAVAFIAFAAPAALLLIARRGETPTLTALAVAAFAVHTCVASGGALGAQQIVLYSALFGGLVLLPTLRKRSLLPVAAIAAGGVLALPVFAVLLRAARGGDAARAFDGPTLTWSWTISTWRDWTTLITSGTDLIHSRADTPWATHETQVPLGLAIAGIVLVPWRRERGLALSLSAALLLVVLFSMKVEPVARWLLALVPPLRLFRVPARAIAPIGVMLTFLAAAAYVRVESELPPERGRRAIIVLSAITALVAVLVLGEVAAMLVSIAYVAARPRWVPQWFGGALLALASVIGVARLLPLPVDEGAMMTELARTRAHVATKHALDRAFVFRPIPLTSNQYAAAGIPTPWGFWFPTRRSVETFGLIHGLQAAPTQHAFGPTGGPDAPSTRTTALLYNMNAWWQYDERDQPTPALALPTLGAAWFPSRTVNAPVTAIDLRREASATVATAEGCDKGAAVVTDTPDGGQRIIINVSSPARCLLVIATNYTEGHRATFRGLAVQLVPANGALIGAVIPPGAGPLVIDHVVAAPRWSTAAKVLGWLMLALTLAAAWRFRATESGA